MTTYLIAGESAGGGKRSHEQKSPNSFVLGRRNGRYAVVGLDGQCFLLVRMAGQQTATCSDSHSSAPR